MDLAKEAIEAFFLQRFCCQDAGTHRYRLGQPFFHGGWHHATDGRILVSLPADGARDTPEVNGKALPRAAEMLAGTEAVEKWEPLPTPTDCKVCKGTGKAARICECDQCENQHTATSDCDDCWLVCGPHHIATKYAELVRQLPGVVWGYSDDGRYLDRVFFKFTGGQGVVMPLRPGHENE